MTLHLKTRLHNYAIITITYFIIYHFNSVVIKA